MSELFAGKYLLKERLGVGGMAEVWLAELKGPQGFSRQLVIKRILPHLADDDNFITMFEDEARLAARLNHPHAVRVEEFGQSGDVWYLAMEYLDGGDLRRLTRAALTRDESVPLEVLLQMGGDVAAALHHAHTLAGADGQPLNMIHRDVSPHNILVTTQGQAKLVDFGIARAESNQVKTRTGMVKGKSGYMSPEQALGRTLDGRSDQFALAIVLYETAAQARIFQGENDLAIMRKVVACEIPPLISVDPNTSLEFSEVLEQALQRSAEDRFPDCDAFAQALYGCLDSAGYRGGHQPVASWVTQMRGVEGKLTKLPSLDQRRDLSGVREEITKISRSRSAMQRASTPQKSQAAAGRLGGTQTAPPPAAAASSWLPLVLAGGLLLLGGVAYFATSQTSQDAPDAASAPSAQPAPEPMPREPRIVVEEPAAPSKEPKVQAAPSTLPPAKAPAAQPAPKVKAKRRVNKPRRARPPAPAQTANLKVTIRAGSDPRSRGLIYINGRRARGATERNATVTLPVGRHEVCVVNQEFGIAKRETVTLPPAGRRIYIKMTDAPSGSCP